MGKRTSIYLSDTLSQRVAQTGTTLATIIAVGTTTLLGDGYITDLEIAALRNEEAMAAVAADRAITPRNRGAESQSAGTETEPTPHPARDKKPATPLTCAHRHAVKGWCPECRTGGHY